MRTERYLRSYKNINDTLWLIVESVETSRQKILSLYNLDIFLYAQFYFYLKWAVWGDSKRTNVAITVSINVSVEALHIKTVR